MGLSLRAQRGNPVFCWAWLNWIAAAFGLAMTE